MSSALPADNKGHLSSRRFDSFPDLCDTVRDAVCVVVGGAMGGGDWIGGLFLSSLSSALL